MRDSAESVEMSRLENLEQKVTKIISKAGINFSGEFKSQYVHSKVEGADVDDTKKTVESVEYTSVDFDIAARPNAAAAATPAVFNLNDIDFILPIVPRA